MWLSKHRGAGLLLLLPGADLQPTVTAKALPAVKMVFFWNQTLNGLIRGTVLCTCGWIRAVLYNRWWYRACGPVWGGLFASKTGLAKDTSQFTVAKKAPGSIGVRMSPWFPPSSHQRGTLSPFPAVCNIIFQPGCKWILVLVHMRPTSVLK